jgi:hypothetical protein
MKKLLFAAKGLSGEEVSQYLSGAGMGYAKSVELNHFPGPMHVLELGERLGLSEQQRAATKQLMDAHKAEARATVDQTTLAEGVRKASTLQGEYRLSHLETHRRMRPIDGSPRVSPEQLRACAFSRRWLFPGQETALDSRTAIARRRSASGHRRMDVQQVRAGTGAAHEARRAPAD